MKHFTLSLLALGLSLAVPARAQQLSAAAVSPAPVTPAPEPLGHYTLLVDSLTQHLDKSRVPTGILYDRALGLAQLGSFTPGQASSGAHFRQAYFDLWTAAYTRPASLLPHTQPQLLDVAEAQVRAGLLPLGVLDARFAVLDTLAQSRGSLTESGGLYYDGWNTSASAYQTKAVCLVTPLADTTTATTTFSLPRALLLQNTGRQLASVRVQLGKQSFTLLPGGSFTTNLGSGGEKTLYFTAAFSDGSTVQAAAAIYVRPTVQARITAAVERPIAPNIIGRTWTSYTGTTTYGEGEARRYLNHPLSKNDNLLRNPIIVIDGYDPSDRRNIDAIAQEFRPLMQLLETAGRERDVVILNFPKTARPTVMPFGFRNTADVDGGADFIERNALVLVELLTRLKPLMANPNQKITVLGPSMGGLISRYGLALMEKNFAATGDAYWLHNVDTWISFDAPHGGANVPLGDQFFLHYFAGLSTVAQDNLQRLNSVAAQQMLVNHAADLTGNRYRKPFMRSLLNNGLPGSQGFPTQVRRVALANGSMNGGSNHLLGYTGQTGIQLDVVRNGSSSTRSFFYRPTAPGTQISANMYFSPGPGQRGDVFNGEARTIVSALRPVASRMRVSVTSSPNGSYDLVQGGTYNSQQQIRDQTVNGRQMSGYSYYFTNVRPHHAFIPTVSALAFQYRNSAAYDGSALLPNPATNLGARQLLCNDETPFDALYAESTVSTPHIALSAGAQQFLVRELYNVSQPARFATGNPREVCAGATATLNLADCAARPGQASYDWSVSGPAVFHGSGTTAAVNGGLRQTIRSTGPGSIVVSVIVRRPNAAPSPATAYTVESGSSGWVALHTSAPGEDVCIGAGVTVYATSYMGGAVANWRVDNGYLMYGNATEARVQVSSTPGTTTVYADYNSTCSGGANGPGGTAEMPIYVVAGQNGYTCISMRTGGVAQPAVYPNPADSYVDVRSPFAAARPYRIELHNDRGARVYAETARSNEARLNTQAYPAGLYHLSLRQGNEVHTYNLSIQH